MHLRLLVLGLLAFLFACKPLKSGAREQFSKQHACPESRVEVRPRGDLRVWDVLVGVTPQPPPDVASDPERIALFRANQQDQNDRMQSSCELYEVRGCSQQQLLCCAHPSAEGGGTYTTAVSCSPGRYPPGIARW